MIDPLIAAMPPPSLPKKNVVAYMAGYLIKRHPVDSCATCMKLCKLQSLPESDPVSQYELIRCNMYKDTSRLVFPSTEFTNFVQAIKSTFSCIFGGVMHMKDLLKTLCKSTDNEITYMHRCDTSDCLARIHNTVKLYMTVRIHHALKISNIGKIYGKRNRKMLKLCHE